MENKKEELETLKSRIRQGNNKLNLAWSQLREIADREEWAEQLEKWSQANIKLSALCTELKLKYSFNECLYLDGEGKKTKKCLPPGGELGCRVCPSERAWWSEELMAL